MSLPSMPADIVVDTGPLVALFDRDDVYHDRAVEFSHQARAGAFSTIAVITESMFILRKNLQARRNLLTLIYNGGLTLVEPQPEDFERIAVLMEKYADLPMDFADAVVVALCERLGTNRIATVDRDFTIYRYKGRTKFINVFPA